MFYPEKKDISTGSRGRPVIGIEGVLTDRELVAESNTVFPIAADQLGSMLRMKELIRILPANQILAAFISGHDKNVQILTEVLIISEVTTDS